MNSQLLLKNRTHAEVKAFTKDHFEAVYAQLTPQQQSQVTHEQLAQDILDTLNGKAPQPISFDLPLRATEGQCIEDVLSVAFDCLGIVMSLIGIGSSESEAVGNAVKEELRADADAINGLAKIMETLQDEGSSAEKKAMAVWKIFSAIVRYTGVKALIKAIKKEMHWYTWLIMAVSIVGQITLWFASDGVAAVAEIVLLVTAMGSTGVDVAHAVEDCENINKNITVPPTIMGTTLQAGQELKAGEALMSADGEYMLFMAHNSNLAIYDRQGMVPYGTGTYHYGKDNSYATLQHDGNFCIYPQKGTSSNAIFCIHDKPSELSGDGCKMVLENDGHLRLYSAAGKMVWMSPDNRK